MSIIRQTCRRCGAPIMPANTPYAYAGEVCHCHDYVIGNEIERLRILVKMRPAPEVREDTTLIAENERLRAKLDAASFYVETHCCEQHTEAMASIIGDPTPEPRTRLAAAQARESRLRAALAHAIEEADGWKDDARGVRCNELDYARTLTEGAFDDSALREYVEREIQRRLAVSGQYLTNDATREAAIETAINSEHRNPWKAAVLGDLTAAHILTAEHESDPRKALEDAIRWNCEVALDPAVSEAMRERLKAERERCAKACDARAADARAPRKHLSAEGEASYVGGAIYADCCADDIRSLEDEPCSPS